MPDHQPDNLPEVPARDVQRGLAADIFNSVRFGGARYVLTGRRGVPIAALVPVADLAPLLARSKRAALRASTRPPVRPAHKEK